MTQKIPYHPSYFPLPDSSPSLLAFLTSDTSTGIHLGMYLPHVNRKTEIEII